MGSENKNGILNHYGGVDRLSIGCFENDRLSAQQQELGAKKFVSLYKTNIMNACTFLM